MDMTTGKIAKWFVESGAAVTKGQPLFEIETDKAAMEIEAPASGTIRDLAAASGTDIPVGSVVAWIFGENEATATPSAAPASATASAKNGMALSAAPTPVSSVPASALTITGDPGRPRATPMARRLARTDGIDLATLTGSGPRGRIQAADVKTRPVGAGMAPPTASAAPSVPASAPIEMRSAVPAHPATVPTDAAAPARMDAPARTDPAAPSPAAPVRSGAGATAGLHSVLLREGQGRPMLLIHGFGAEANGWRPMLAGHGGARPIHALDLPGHGASPLGALAAFADLVDAVEAHLRAMGLGDVDLVGHSLGGAVAAALAARGTLDLRSLLLLAPAGLVPAVNGAFVEGFLRATSEASLAPWMAELVADPAAITPAFVRATLKARQGTGLVETQRRVTDAVFPDGTQAFSIRADLATLAVPTRILVGTADRIIPATGVDGLPGRIAVHRFPGIGHMPHFEARDATLAIITEMTR